MRGVKITSLALLCAAALAAVPATAGSATDAHRCRAGVLHRVGTAKAAYAAVAIGKTATFKRPRGDRLAIFGKVNENGYPTTFSIVGAILNGTCSPTWYRVKLPMRPNGVVGYVRPSDVAVRR